MKAKRLFYSLLTILIIPFPILLFIFCSYAFYWVSAKVFQKPADKESESKNVPAKPNLKGFRDDSKDP